MLSTISDIDVAWFEVGRGTPVVLIHGLADDHRAWRRAVTPLMLCHRVLLYDLRGHGGTSLGAPDGTLRQLAGDLIGLVRHLDLDRVVLAGFSLGGTIAMQTAVDAPELVGGLALVATSSRVNSAACAWYLERAALVDEDSSTLRATLDQDTEDVYRNRPSEIADGLAIRRSATQDPSGFANACRAMAALRDTPLDGVIPSISAPTLILAGDCDKHCPPRAGEIIAGLIRGSELRVLRDAGHPLPVEHPGEVVAAITELADAAPGS